MASCKVLFCLSSCCYSNPRKICFQFSKMETSACNFENPCQGPYLLFWSALFDMWSPQRSSKGTDPSRQTSASHKGSLPVDSCPLSNEKAYGKATNSQTLILSPSPQPVRESSHIKRLSFRAPRSSLPWRGLSPTFPRKPTWILKILPLTHAPFERWWELTLFSIGQQESWVLLLF